MGTYICFSHSTISGLIEILHSSNSFVINYVLSTLNSLNNFFSHLSYTVFASFLPQLISVSVPMNILTCILLSILSLSVILSKLPSLIPFVLTMS